MHTEFSTEINELTSALIDFQAKCPQIKKNRQSMYGAYADLAGILDTIRNPLIECGLAVVQMPDGKFGLTTIVSHKSGQWLRSYYEMEALPQVIDKQTRERAITPQSLGSVVTYQRRYALCAALGISAEEDNDAKTKLAKSADGKKKKSAAELLKTATEPSEQTEQPMVLAASDAGSQNTSTGAVCSADDVTAVKRMVADWEAIQPGVAQQFAERMAATGRKLASFSITEIEQLKAAIGKKTLESFFEHLLAKK